MCKRVSHFDFGKADCRRNDWSALLRSDCVDECVQKFYDAIYECFEYYVPKYIVTYSTVKYPWFDRELHNVANYIMKAHKNLKEFEIGHVRPMSESAVLRDSTV
jgi:hypothetical protein